jgi:hypothetical protein
MRDLLRNSLRDLAKAAEAQVRNGVLTTALEQVRAVILQRFPAYRETEVDTYMQGHRNQGDLSEHGKYLYLPAMTAKRPRLVFCSVRYDFEDGREALSLQIVTVMGAQVAKNPASYGYRFECPHNRVAGKAGDHDFFHAQPISHIRLHDGTKLELPGARVAPAHDEPSFPLDADGPADLLAAALVALYGNREARELDARRLQGRLGHCFSGMRTLG